MSTSYAIVGIILVILLASLLTIGVVKHFRSTISSDLTKEVNVARTRDRLTKLKSRLQEVEENIKRTSNSAELLIYCKQIEQLIAQVFNMNKSGSVIPATTLDGFERVINMLESANEKQ